MLPPHLRQDVFLVDRSFMNSLRAPFPFGDCLSERRGDRCALAVDRRAPGPDSTSAGSPFIITQPSLVFVVPAHLVTAARKRASTQTHLLLFSFSPPRNGEKLNLFFLFCVPALSDGRLSKARGAPQSPDNASRAPPADEVLIAASCEGIEESRDRSESLRLKHNGGETKSPEPQNISGHNRK